MPDHFVSPSNRRSKQLHDQTSTCPRCGCAADISSSEHSICSNCSGPVLPDGQASAILISPHDLTTSSTKSSVDKAAGGGGSAVLSCDHLAVASTKPEAVEYRHGTSGHEGGAYSIFNTTISKPAAGAAIVEGLETATRTRADTRCTAEQVAPMQQPISLTDLFRVVSSCASARELVTRRADEAAACTDIELESRPAAAFRNVPRCRRSSSTSSTPAGQKRPERSCRMKRSSSVKLREKKVRAGPAAPVSEVAAALRSSSGTNETRTRRTKWSKSESEHKFYGVRTRRGVRGFLVEIRPQKWKNTIWLGTYDTPMEAAAAYDAGVFYTDKPKKKYNLIQYLKFPFPPLPPHLDVRSSSPAVKNEVKVFVKKQAILASKMVKEHANRSSAAVGYGSSLDRVQAGMEARSASQAASLAGASDLQLLQAPIMNARLVDTVPESTGFSSAAATLGLHGSCNRDSDFEMDQLAGIFFCGPTLQQYRCGLPMDQLEPAAAIWSQADEPSWQRLGGGCDDLIPVIKNISPCSLLQQDDHHLLQQDEFGAHEFKCQPTSAIAAATTSSNLGMLQAAAAGSTTATCSMICNNHNSHGIRMGSGTSTMFNLVQQDSSTVDFSCIAIQNYLQQQQAAEMEFDNSNMDLFTQLMTSW